MSAHERTALVLQGGGALGAYQAGAYAALAEAGHAPDWIAGISIGAINAALIAGNPPERRVERLRTFWERVSSGSAGPLPTAEPARAAWSYLSAGRTLAAGAEGFFRPRLPPPWLRPPGSPGALSVYDSAPLRATLESLVDFERLNAEGPRVSVGAVHVRSGNKTWFDSHERTLDAEHIMASGALPPGLPPVTVDGEPYWDGGLISNTPLQRVIDERPGEDWLIFQLDVFSARGPLPEDLLDVAEREKDIRYSSRTRLNTDVFRDRQRLRQAAARLLERLPPELADDPDARLLREQACPAAITIVHLIHRRRAYHTHAKDYDFSRAAIRDHWDAGAADVARTLAHPDWRGRERPARGVQVLDCTREPEA